MVRTTSKIAYKDINKSGATLTQRSTILSKMNPDEGYSLREIVFLTGYEINAVSGRVNELKKDHLLIEGYKRKCSKSGRLITPVFLAM